MIIKVNKLLLTLTLILSANVWAELIYKSDKTDPFTDERIISIAFLEDDMTSGGIVGFNCTSETITAIVEYEFNLDFDSKRAITFRFDKRPAYTLVFGVANNQYQLTEKEEVRLLLEDFVSSNKAAVKAEEREVLSFNDYKKNIETVNNFITNSQSLNCL